MPGARAKRGVRQIEREQRENAEIERGRREIRDVGSKGRKRRGRRNAEGGAYESKREIEGERDKGKEGDRDRLGKTGHAGHTTATLSVLMRNNVRNCCFEPTIRNAYSACIPCTNESRTISRAHYHRTCGNAQYCG